ncbi:MAG: hypothetical protein IKY83_02925 [Proteobacteria bacterium]|nr:hypothetical protein [Pseudomonadota bacterium]
MKKSYLFCVLVGLASLGGCNLDNLNEFGEMCPPVEGDHRVAGELKYIESTDCTKEKCSFGDYDVYFKAQRCPITHRYCEANADGDGFHCMMDVSCSDDHIRCQNEEYRAGVCIDPSSLETCGAKEANCADGAPFGGEDCTKLGIAECKKDPADPDSWKCKCPDKAELCGDKCFDSAVSRTCGASCEDGVWNPGKNCDEDYDSPRVCRNVEGQWRCMCDGQLTLDDSRCVATKDDYHCDDETNTCLDVIDGLIVCRNTAERCGEDCDNCTHLHDNAVCINGKCVIESCKEGEHPDYTAGVMTCVPNEKTSCAPVDMAAGGQAKDCSQMAEAQEGVADMDCLPHGECVITACDSGYHLTEAGECEADSASACGEHGEIDCHEGMPENAVEPGCESSACVVVTCAEGYHPNENRDACEANTDELCAGPSSNAVVDCTGLQVDQAVHQVCASGACIVSECAAGFHISEDHTKCEANTDTLCGASGSNQVVDCSKDIPAHATSRVCKAGVCAVVGCVAGYRISSDGLSCVENNVTACGSASTDCTKNLPAHATSRVCEVDTCKVSACEANYHLSADRLSCIANSDTACGVSNSTSTVNCTQNLPASATERKCINSECKVTKCAANYHINSNNLSCVANSDAACGAINSTSTVNCGQNLPASATERKCISNECRVTKCAANYHIHTNNLSCVANSDTACGAVNSSSTVNCTQNLPANAAERKCISNECRVTKCATNYHIHTNNLSCVANSDSACGAVNSSSTVNCGKDLPSNAKTRICEKGACKVTKCATDYHVKEARTGCAKNSASACGGVSWNGSGSYSSYVKSCSSPTSACVSGACNCSGYPDKVLNVEKNACVPKVCQGIPGIKKGSVQTQNYYDPTKSDNACHADTCQSNYTMYSQSTGAMCRPSSSKYTCGDMGYKYSSGGYCRGCTSGGTCGHNHCKDGYRYFLMACLPSKYCCGTRGVDMKKVSDFACRNCVAEGYKKCDTSTGKCTN